MITRDIIVIGASAGGVAALKELVKSLPVNLQAAVFIVLHIPTYSETNLHKILTQSGPIKAVLAEDGMPIENGKIYIAPSDHHLLLAHDKVMVKRGPKENRFRPSIDALFRSAAYVFGPRVIGVILSGMLDDGTSGIWNIKQLGGLAIVQEPEDAEQPQMPINALEYVKADYIVSIADMAPLIAGMVTEQVVDKFKLNAEQLKRLKTEVIIAMQDNAYEMGIMDMGEFTPFTCPECHGSLIKLVEGNIIRFRCHTGHAYTASSLLAEVTESVEGLLWQSMRGMEEINMLLKNIGDNFEKLENNQAAALFREKAKTAAERARLIHDYVFKQEQYSEDLRINITTTPEEKSNS